ncbi:MAG: electron transfer flavoprotein subunit beta/FixA family protein [Dehalococcoidia bacterium]|nr:electron transfer flavoprotein subunit beta/FixA family protein [Dehalococcoidia bacterium]
MRRLKVHIVVCVKQVPDYETPAPQLRVDDATKTVSAPPGVAPVVSQFDAIAVEAALRIKEAQGDGQVTIVTVGPDGAREVIKQALAMGADEGILVNDPALTGLDSFGTAHVLAAVVRKLGDVTLVFCGRQATDWDMGVVPAGIGELLGWPIVSIVKSVTAENGKVQAERVLTDGFQKVESELPAVVSVSNELGEPRYPQLRQIMLAARKQVTNYAAGDLGVDPDELSGAGLTLEKIYKPVYELQTEFVEADSPQEAGAQLAVRLREAKII